MFRSYNVYLNDTLIPKHNFEFYNMYIYIYIYIYIYMCDVRDKIVKTDLLNQMLAQFLSIFFSVNHLVNKAFYINALMKQLASFIITVRSREKPQVLSINYEK